jgi:D-glycero-D-manno-heptose 1,7-bisphosphate phosphatase
MPPEKSGSFAYGPNCPAVFLDRDGTLVADAHYASSPDQIRLLPGAGAAVAALNRAGFLAVVLTNQSGVARGYFSEEDLHAMHVKLSADLALHGARLDAIHFCPHHPDGKPGPFAVACDCRKPAPGMLFKALHEHPIDPARSFLVGDALRDLFPGADLPLRRILVLTGRGRESLAELDRESIQPDHVAQDLAAATAWILSR